jgi:hypothetical protein
MFATYSMVFVKDTQSLINNYYNHKVCFQWKQQRKIINTNQQSTIVCFVF